MSLSAEAKAARNAYMREYRRNMTAEQRDREREYQKNWRKNNPDLVQEYQKAYWERKAKEMEVTA